MRAFVQCAAFVLVLSCMLRAGNDTPDAIKAKADAAHGGEQAKLCLEYAHLELESANALFDQGEVDKAQAEIHDVVTYAQKGVAAASKSGKQLKDTEIRLRKLAERMHDIAESLAFEDRQPVRDAVDQLQQLRSDLMVRMWGPQAEPVEPKGKS